MRHNTVKKPNESAVQSSFRSLVLLDHPQNDQFCDDICHQRLARADTTIDHPADAEAAVVGELIRHEVD